MDELTIEGLTELQQIGRGGFATVFKARQESANRYVAVKVLRAVLEDEPAARFDRECRALGSLSSHPGICTLYSFGQTTAGQPYLVLGLCELSLADRLAARGPMPWTDVAPVLHHLADAVGFAHTEGILHRDIKPENVLVTKFGNTVLSDFGIARLNDGHHTATGMVTASLAHAAPEVLEGLVATPASDVWSLASTGYHLLTGMAPFRRATDESAAALLARVFREPPPNLRDRDVPPAFCDALEAAMAKDPDDRTPTMEVFGAAMAAFSTATSTSHLSNPVDLTAPDESTVPRDSLIVGIPGIVPVDDDPAAPPDLDDAAPPSVVADLPPPIPDDPTVARLIEPPRGRSTGNGARRRRAALVLATLVLTATLAGLTLARRTEARSSASPKDESSTTEQPVSTTLREPTAEELAGSRIDGRWGPVAGTVTPQGCTGADCQEEYPLLELRLALITCDEALTCTFRYPDYVESPTARTAEGYTTVASVSRKFSCDGASVDATVTLTYAPTKATIQHGVWHATELTGVAAFVAPATGTCPGGSEQYDFVLRRKGEI